MPKGLAVGIYKAKVKGFSLELVGEKEHPVLKVIFLPLEKQVGPVFVPAELNTPDANKAYFLTEKIIEKGENAGRSSIEVLRDDLKRTYDYEGDLDPAQLDAIIGKEVVITVKEGRGEYTEVAWVNKPGDRPRGGAKKEMPADVLAKFNRAFKGGAKAPTSASDFFQGL